jgi:hypothetical protein
MKLFWSASDQLMGSSPGLDTGRSGGDSEESAGRSGVRPESLDRDSVDCDLAWRGRVMMDGDVDVDDSEASFADELAPTQMTRCG